MALDRAIRRFDRGETERGEQEIRYLRDTISGTVAELRSVLSDLCLEILTFHGLVDALEEYINNFSKMTGISVEMRSSLEQRLPNHIELLIYRLAQEALANIRKHAEATKVSVELALEGERLFMTISDDGRGFDVDNAMLARQSGKHLGLQSMRQRIRDAQGSLSIESVPGAGTTLKFWCPIPAARKTGTTV
jgi:signal transduction histidine kinase